MWNGILNIYKEKGYTSHDVVAKLRGIVKQKKIGHTGTLDPDAEGVLPVCLGKATRLCDMLTDQSKTYEAVLLLGKTTDTQDITGQILEEQETGALTEEEVRACIAGFTGEYAQLPPMYSALKVNGRKLYELARQGIEVERKKRNVTIHEILIQEVSLPRIRMRVHCSKGTYIRTLCHDIGRELGCGGCMASLQRTMAAGFTLEDAVSLEQIQIEEDPVSLLLSVDCLFADRPVLVLNSAEAEKKIRNGMTAVLPELPSGEYRVYSKDEIFLALCQAKGGKLTTIKSFFEV